MTVKDIIKKAMLDIGAIAAGEVPTSDEINDGLDALNFMLAEWAGVDSGIVANRDVAKTLALGVGSYTVGPAGDFAVQRPERIAGAFLRDASGNDIPLRVLESREEYSAIPNKSEPGRPSLVFYDVTLPAGTLLVWPVPTEQLSLHLLIPEPFTKLIALTTDLSSYFPPGYETAIRWNLGLELCPMYGKSVSMEHLGKCKTSRDRIVNTHFARKVVPVNVNSLVGGGSGFNILDT